MQKNHNILDNSGFIKIHRKFINWEWYDDINTKVLFIHLILKANYTDKNWHGIEVKRGSLITSTQNLSTELGVSIRQVRTSLTKLKSTSELTIKTTNKYSLISITYYDKYQSNDKQYVSQTTNERQSNDNQTTTTKESKEYKEGKEVNIYDDYFNEFWECYTPIRDSNGDWVAKGSKKECKKKFIKIMSEGVSYEEIISSLKQYLEYCKTANRQSCGAEVFLNQRRWENDYSCEQTVKSDSGAGSKRQKPVNYLEVAARVAARYENKGKDDIY